MGKILSWVSKSDFLEKNLWAPYSVKKDIDYYDDLCKKYNSLYKDAMTSGADADSLKIIKKYSEKIRKAIRNYYAGKISNSHRILQNLVRDVMDNSLAVSPINDSYAFLRASAEIQFFRARVNEKVTSYAPKDMLHVPFSMRGKASNNRFSIPGIPSLYLCNSSYACWLEMGCPPDYKFNVSPFLLDGSQRVLNLAVATRKQFFLDEWDEERVHCWLKLIMLMIATSYTIEEDNRAFKSEYIISQSLSLASKELGLDGVIYYSKRVDDEAFANAAKCVALFTDYKKGKEYSEICKRIKVNDSYNFALYKHLGQVDRNPEYEFYALAKTGEAVNIGTYKRQFSYAGTEFCAFDKFLFATWKDKDDIDYGNALE